MKSKVMCVSHASPSHFLSDRSLCLLLHEEEVDAHARFGGAPGDVRLPSALAAVEREELEPQLRVSLPVRVARRLEQPPHARVRRSRGRRRRRAAVAVAAVARGGCGCPLELDAEAEKMHARGGHREPLCVELAGGADAARARGELHERARREPEVLAPQHELLVEERGEHVERDDAAPAQLDGARPQRRGIFCGEGGGAQRLDGDFRLARVARLRLCVQEPHARSVGKRRRRSCCRGARLCRAPERSQKLHSIHSERFRHNPRLRSRRVHQHLPLCELRQLCASFVEECDVELKHRRSGHGCAAFLVDFARRLHLRRCPLPRFAAAARNAVATRARVPRPRLRPKLRLEALINLRRERLRLLKPLEDAKHFKAKLERLWEGLERLPQNHARDRVLEHELERCRLSLLNLLLPRPRRIEPEQSAPLTKPLRVEQLESQVLLPKEHGLFAHAQPALHERPSRGWVVVVLKLPRRSVSPKRSLGRVATQRPSEDAREHFVRL
mmetsp:Transcript_324/g.1013  ORF Transcript_324/g.1013 Transcript_324/m.1013 type:complete len:500 (+) Transcript_324:39-1538(+)